MAITRAEGTKLINQVFTDLDMARAHYSSEEYDFIPGMKELKDEVTRIIKLRSDSEYNYWLKNLDIAEYEKYFKKVTEIAEIFELRQTASMKTVEFLKLQNLSSAFGQTSKYDTRLDIINTFSLDDLQNWDKDYPEKEALLIKLLDKWFMNDDGKDTINKFLSSFSQRDKEKFIEKTITNPEILELLLKKINMGDEKNNLLKTFIDFGNNTNIDKNEYEIPKGKVFNASFVDKKLYVNLLKLAPGEENIYEIEKQIQLQTPFTNVSFYYGDDNRITVPAISLIGRDYDDVLYDDFYKNNINLKELTDEEKEALFNEFVQHYLGKEFIAEYLSNPLGLLKSIGITIAVGILLIFASEALTIGIAIAGSAYGSIVSALSLRSGLSMLGGANEEKQNAENINDFKSAAKHTAEAMIKIGVNGISLITSLIQFGEACWKGGKLYYKNKKIISESLNKTEDLRFNKYKQDKNGKWHRPDGKFATKSEIEFNKLTISQKRELIENISNDELYNLINNDYFSNWITKNYNLITKDNIKEILLFRKDGSFNLDWPKYAGLQLKTIQSIGDMKGKIFVSRSGSVTGNTLGYGDTIDSWYASNSKRSIPSSNSKIKTGVMDVDKYKKVIEIINSNLSDFSKSSILQEEFNLSEDISDLLIRSYYEWNGKRYEVFGTNGIVEGLKSINKPIDSSFGYSGKISPWKIGNLNMEGGAGQLNTCFSWELLENSCIINDVGDIIIK